MVTETGEGRSERPRLRERERVRFGFRFTHNTEHSTAQHNYSIYYSLPFIPHSTFYFFPDLNILYEPFIIPYSIDFLLLDSASRCATYRCTQPCNRGHRTSFFTYLSTLYSPNVSHLPQCSDRFTNLFLSLLSARLRLPFVSL